MAQYPTLHILGIDSQFPDAMKPSGFKELLHYVIVFGIILVAWPQAMAFWNGDLNLTALTVFYIFVAADGLAHKYILGER